jgi:predicted esterase
VILTVLILLILLPNLLPGQNKQINYEQLLLEGRKLQRALLKLPEDFSSNNSYTLLITLHGNGGKASSIASLFSNFTNEKIIVAAPEGQYPKIVSGDVGYGWFYPTNDKSVWEKADLMTIENILNVIAEISSKYQIEKTYILGFSQGVSLAYMIAFTKPGLINGIIAIGGFLPELDSPSSLVTTQQIKAANEIKLLIAIGNEDMESIKKNCDYQNKFFQSMGFEVLYHQYKGGHNITTGLLDEILIWIKKNAI